MFQVSSSEVAWVEKGVAMDLRSDGRGRLDYRHFTLETGVISQTNGSARLKLDTTDVLVGVKVDLGEPKPEAPDQGILRFSVECSPSISPEFEGRGGDELNVELASILARANHNALDLKSLCVIPGKLCWTLYVDALVMDSSGNLVDALSIATRAALQNTTIPKIEVDEEEGFEVSDDPLESTRPDISNVPVCVTLTKLGQHFIADATLQEEQCKGVRVIVSVNGKGNINAVQMGGHGGVSPSLLKSIIQEAKRIGVDIINALDDALQKEQEYKRDGSSSSSFGFFLS